MSSVHYFGYGSLVNRQTRPPTEAFEATSVAGWQRSWSHRVNNPEAASVELVCASSTTGGLDSVSAQSGPETPVGYSTLTVVPAPGVQIDGVVVSINARDLPTLDEREKGYSRCTVQSVKSTDPVAMYVSQSEHVNTVSSAYPLVQSYVDCVLAGFLTVFGWEGVDRFIATTTGWATPILADRAAPLYPRAVSLEPDLEQLFDERIAAARTRQH